MIRWLQTLHTELAFTNVFLKVWYQQIKLQIITQFACKFIIDKKLQKRIYFQGRFRENQRQIGNRDCYLMRKIQSGGCSYPSCIRIAYALVQVKTLALLRAVQILFLQHNVCTCKFYVTGVDPVELGLPKIHTIEQKMGQLAKCAFLSNRCPYILSLVHNNCGFCSGVWQNIHCSL